MLRTERTLAFNNPVLAAEWDYSKNDRTPSEVTFSSAYRAFWICNKCGHNWEQSVNHRKNGRGCPKCAGRVIEAGVNDFASIHPEYATWWNSPDIQPSSFLPGSKKIVNWRCPQGHTFDRQIRKFKGTCPRCVSNPLSARNPELGADWGPENTKTMDEVSYNSAQVVSWLCASCQHEWNTPVYQRANGSACPKCSRLNKTSQAENDISDFLEGEGLVKDEDFIRHYRGEFLQGKELDFYFPKHNFAIEFNGLYWHSEAAGKDRNYHYEKWSKCATEGIQLVYVWEDDYLRNPMLVKQMILHKLGLTRRERIYARKTELKEVDYQLASAFLNEHHIQGAVQGSIYLGLWYEDQMVAVSVWTSTKDSLYLDRFATSQHVVGGLGKMLKYATQYKVTDNHKQIITFAAHDVSNGNLYEKLGFVQDRIIKPDYWYLYNKIRVHKFNFRKHRFDSDPNLKYVPGLTETELAILNGIPRIWDAGKVRWVKNL